MDLNISSQFAGTGKVLRGVISEFGHRMLRTDPPVAVEVTRYLKTMDDILDGVRSIDILDKDGVTIASSRSELIDLPPSEDNFNKSRNLEFSA